MGKRKANQKQQTRSATAGLAWAKATEINSKSNTALWTGRESN